MASAPARPVRHRHALTLSISSGKFFERLDDVFVLSVMERPYGKLAVAKRPKCPAHCRFVRRTVEFLEHPGDEIYDPPAYYSIDGRGPLSTISLST